MDAADASKDLEMVSKKVDELKAQGEIVSQALFKQVDKVNTKKKLYLDLKNYDCVFLILYHTGWIVCFIKFNQGF